MHTIQGEASERGACSKCHQTRENEPKYPRRASSDQSASAAAPCSLLVGFVVSPSEGEPMTGRDDQLARSAALFSLLVGSRVRPSGRLGAGRRRRGRWPGGRGVPGARRPLGEAARVWVGGQGRIGAGAGPARFGPCSSAESGTQSGAGGRARAGQPPSEGISWGGRAGN
jgi:hypothetical protein